jgi:hypothetical protein
MLSNEKEYLLVKALITTFDTQSTCYLFYCLCTACGQPYKIREFPQKFKKGVGGRGGVTSLQEANLAL